MALKDSSYLQLWWASCLVERNHLSSFDREHYEEYFCKINLSLDQWFRRRIPFQDISYLELLQPSCSGGGGGPVVQEQMSF